MTIGEVEEFLWTLSKCLEGQIGDWYVRFGGTTVSVRVDASADRVAISAPIAFPSEDAPRGHAVPTGVRYLYEGSEWRATLVARLSELQTSRLQAGFQHVVDSAQKIPGGA